MIKSMTGFASLTKDDPSASIGVTLKSVNHRFLDLQLRTPGSGDESAIAKAWGTVRFSISS